MLEKILQLLSVSCRHHKISQPFTAALAAGTGTHSSAAAWDEVSPAATHYVVCLECGKKFNYDWQRMRIVR